MNTVARNGWEEPRFEFMGFGSRGTCFVRTQVRQGGVIVLCAQLKKYQGTSVTNAIEDIYSRVVSRLAKEGALKLPGFRLWSFFKRENSFESIASQIVWVEYYPPGAGMFPNGSYALVNFDSQGSPVWNYVSREYILQECGLDQWFLEISPELLEYAN